VVIASSNDRGGSRGVAGLILLSTTPGLNGIKPDFVKAESIVDFLKVCCHISVIAARNLTFVIFVHLLWTAILITLVW